MNSQFAFALFIGVSVFAFAAAIPAASMQCSDNEIFKPCGSACAPSCKNPNPGPACTRQCVIGCFCKEGYLRNANGICVESHKCEEIEAENPMLFAFPSEMMQCKENEFFTACGSACAPTCKNPIPSTMCTRQCVPGCFCKSGFLKNEQGICVQSEKCEEKTMPLPTCNGDNEEFRQCKGCDGTCENRDPLCPRICIPGCACKKDHVRDGNGRCMHIKQCPIQQQQAPENIIAPMCIGENEQYRSCKRCDGTCDNPNPICPRSPRICRPGCACKEGHVRDASGVCIRLNKCPVSNPLNIILVEPQQPKCPQNEIFRSCGSACPATCENPHPSPICTRQCIVGCFCQEGYLRHKNGACVQAASCKA